MPLIIDGHNLIGQMRNISLSDPDDEEQLLERLASYQSRRRDEMVVVFDSGPQGGLPGGGRREGGLRVVYARAGQRADDVIIRLVRARGGSTCQVVTSDRAVQAEVRGLGANVIPSQEFARRLQPAPQNAPRRPSEKERPPSASEVEAWLEIFARRKPKRR